MSPLEDARPDLVGDGHDPEPLLTARDLADTLRLPEKSVYDLPIPRVRISSNRVRWRPADVRAYIYSRRERP